MVADENDENGSGQDQLLRTRPRTRSMRNSQPILTGEPETLSDEVLIKTGRTKSQEEDLTRDRTVDPGQEMDRPETDERERTGRTGNGGTGSVHEMK